MKSRIITIAGAAMLALAGSAAADNTKASAEVEVDANRDGKITKTEAKTNKELSAQFSKLDTNKDGNLDSAEYAAFEATNPNEAANPDVPNTTDDTVPGNKDKLGPSR